MFASFSFKKPLIGQQDIDVLKTGDTLADFWDLGNEKIGKGSFQKENEALELKLLSYGKNPEELQERRKKHIFWGILGSCIGLATFVLFQNEIFLIIIFFSWMPFLYFITTIKNIQEDTLKKKICDDGNWEYSPLTRRSKWEALSSLYHELFLKGDKNQNIQDEIWGNVEKDGQKVSFWSGTFEYQVEHRDSKGKKSTSTHHETIFAFHIPKTLKNTFLVKPNVFLGGFFSRLFGQKTLSTESVDFNNEFLVEYKGEEGGEIEVMTKLSPKVQELLLEFEKAEENFTLLMKGESAIFSMSGILIKKIKTNFFESFTVHPDDTKAILDRLQKMLDISTEMVVFLD